MAEKRTAPGAREAQGPVQGHSSTPRTVLGLAVPRNNVAQAKPERPAEQTLSEKLFAGLSWTAGIPAVLREPLPLRVGLGEDLALLLPEAQWRQLRRALSAWCNTSAYLTAVAVDEAQRHDADGEPVGPVSEADRLNAAHQLLARELATARNAAAKAEGRP